MNSEQNKSIKGDFRRAHDGANDLEKNGSERGSDYTEAINSGHDKIGDGPRPPVEGRPAPEVIGAPGPGGSTPSQSAVDRHRASRHEKAERGATAPDMTKDDPKLSRNFNNRSTR